MHQEDGIWRGTAGLLQAVGLFHVSYGNDRNNHFCPFQSQGEVDDLSWKL